MRAKTTSPISFSSWKHWTQREELAEAGDPGVYLLLKLSTTPPEGRAKPLQNEIVYIGETGRTMFERWGEFNRVAFGRGSNHAGGVNYRERIADNGDCLYVAAMSVRPQDGVSGDLRFRLKRQLLEDYRQAHGKLPMCNKI